MRKFRFTLLCLLIALYGYSQVTLEGNIYDDENIPLDYFNALLLSVRDSSMIQGNVFYDGFFRMEGIPAGSYRLKIINVKYETLDTILVLGYANQTALSLCLKKRYLNEVVVTARKKIFSQQNGNLSLDIQHSFLRDEISLIEILRKSPGVLVDADGNASVIGRERTQIQINGKRIHSNSELNTIRPSDIDKIEIINNPSVDQDAGIDAVILIKTKSRAEDYIDFSFTHESTLSRRYSSEEDISGGFRIGKVLNYLSYNYHHNRKRVYDLNRSEIIHDGYTDYYERTDTNNWGDRMHNILYSMEYQINKKNKLGVQYTGNVSSTDTNMEGWHETYLQNGREQVDYVTTAQTKYSLHNIGINYKHEMDSCNKFAFLADYALSKRDQENRVSEQDMPDGEIEETSWDDKDKYHIFSADARFQSIGKWLDYSTGAKYTYMYDDAISNLMEDQIAAIYFSGEKKKDSWSARAGIRMEYTLSEITYTNGETKPIRREHLDLFPQAQVENRFSDKFSLSFGYARRINRISLSQLNPRYKYLDALSYSIGNPQLKPTFENQFYANLESGSFLFSATYKMNKNLVVPINEQENPATNMIRHTTINLSHSKQMNLNLIYQGNYRTLSNYISLSYNQPFMEIPYANAMRKIRKPVWLIEYMGNLNVGKSTSFTLYFFYQSKGDQSTLRVEPCSNLYFGINQFFKDKTWQLSLTVNDILNMCKFNNWEKSYNTVSTIMDSNQDTRSISLSIRYNFGLSKTKIQRESANTESLNRR